MSTSRGQTLELAYVAVPATTRRRCLPPRPRVPVPMSLHQRWRERPRSRALHLTPGCWDGVVHAIVGRVPCRCPHVQFVQETRAARAPLSCPDASAELSLRFPPRSVRAPPWFFSRTWPGLALRSSRATIARMMLVSCSSSSMLSATLRPGRWPSLRALTTPARGTDWQWRDGDHCDDGHTSLDMMAHTRLTRTACRRMVGSSLQCRPALLRFATTASGARIRPMLSGHGSSAPFTTSQSVVMTSRGAAFSGPRATTRQRSPEA